MSRSMAAERIRAIADEAAKAVEQNTDVWIAPAARAELVPAVLENSEFVASLERDEPEAHSQFLDAATSIFMEAAQRSRAEQQALLFAGGTDADQPIVVTTVALVGIRWPWPIGPA